MAGMRDNRLTDSLRGMRDTRRLILCAMLIALQTALGILVSIPLGPSIRVTFGYIVVAISAVLLGPAPAAIGAMASDLLAFLLHPTGPFFPGFTLSAGLGGLTYGLMLYRRECTLWRVLAAKLIIDLLVNVVLNTLWLKILYGNAFFALLPSRLLKNVIQYPVDVLLLYPIVRWAGAMKTKLGL